MAKEKHQMVASGDTDNWQAEDDMRTLARAREIHVKTTRRPRERHA
ncbi:hypothetical protein [Comamonas sp. NoAH]|nr:hypothetical protein [Comamonas sp. NoAH]